MIHPVLIVSAFGRGQGLAARLRAQEIPVRLVDVTPDLGVSSAEDEEGPFGFFSSSISQEGIERLHQDDAVENLNQGMTLVLKSGPVQLRSSLTEHRLKMLGVGLQVLDEKKSQTFSEAWLGHFAQTFSGTSFQHFPLGRDSEDHLQINDHFWIRTNSRAGTRKSLDWAERQGVHVDMQLSVLDLAQENSRKLRSLEVKTRGTQTSQMIGFEKLVWCLTSEETAFISKPIQNKIFPKGPLSPEWVWQRLRLRLSDSLDRSVLPEHSVWFQDLELPWTHSNLIVLQKSAAAELWDFWIRIPADHRLQKAELLRYESELIQFFQKRLPMTTILGGEDFLPEEKTSGNLPPARFSLYRFADLLRFRSSHDENLILHSPEVWPGHGWNALFAFEKKVISGISGWWEKREELRKKREMKEAAR